MRFDTMGPPSGPEEADAFVHGVVSGWRSAPLSEADRALYTHAVRLTKEQDTVTPEDLDRLRSVGFDDVAIHAATQVVAYFNYITRNADGLGIDPEDFIRPWRSEA